MNLNKKGSSTLTSFILYIFISIAVLAIVTTSATAIIRNLRQENNYNQMLSSIDELEKSIQFVSQNKYNIADLIIKNPETLIVDCNNNKLIGTIQYDKKYSIEPVLKNDIITYKKENNIYFEKRLPTTINLECKSLFLNEGNNKLKVNYFSYDPITEKINIDVLQNIKEREAEWYNSKWSFREKIIIDSTKVEEDLINFPTLLSLKSKNLFYSKDDGSDIIFTSKDGRSLLKREIESFQDSLLYRKKIIIDSTKVEEDLTDFPVLISLEDKDLATYSKEDGSDIYFTLEDGTKLKREIESFEKNYRQKIIIDSSKVEEDLTDFPVLISLQSQDLKNYAKEDGSDIFFTLMDNTRLKREIESFENINSYRKKITIDHTKIDANLTNFPVLISIEDQNLITFSKEDGSDIYFTLEDGTRLKREIEDYNSITGTLITWVKIPELSSTIDTNIYMYFGDHDENNTNDTDVWDDNYVFVQHFNNNVLDSTNNNRNGTINGSPLYVDGITGKALKFNGNPDSVTIDYSEDLSGTGNFSVSAWVKYTGNQTYVIVQSHTLPPSTYASDWFFPFSSSIFWMRTNYLGNANLINDDNWHQVTMVWDKSTEKYKGYIDGQFIGESNTISGYGGTGTIKIGGRGDLTTTFFEGIIDNVKVSNSIHSAERIKTEYNNQVNPSLFYTIEDLETITKKKIIAWVKIPELSSTVDTEIYMYFGNENENNANDKDVWDDNFTAVQHFNNNLLDSTKYGVNGTITGTITPFKDIFNTYNAYYFGTDNYVTIPKPIDQNNLEQIWTVDAWFKIEDKAGFQSLLSSGFNRGNYIMYSSTGNSLLYLNSGDNDYYTYGAGTNININTWQKITFRFRNSDGYRTIYLNGQNISIGGPNKTSTPTGISSTVRIGDSLRGALDELRISNILRSDAWIKTEYNNQVDPFSFYTVEETEYVSNLVAWVKIPELSSTVDTEIYMYFGDSDENNTNDTDVWDDNFMMVQHFNDNLLDSTKNNRNGTNFGAKLVSGVIGKSIELNGINEYIQTTPQKYSTYTLSAWIDGEREQTVGGIIFSDGGSYYRWGLSLESKNLCSLNTNDFALDRWCFEKYDYINYPAGFHKVVVTDDGTTRKFYKNGELIKTYTNQITNSGGNQTINIGKGGNTGASYFKGKIDNVNISNIARSPSWIKTEYTNQVNPNGFYTIEDLEEINIKELITWVRIPKLSSTTDTEIYMYYGNSDGNKVNDTDVWDTDFIGVWHKNDLTTSTIKDSTNNYINGTKIASNQPLEIDGKIGFAQKYNNTHIDLGQNNILTKLNETNGITVSAWIKPNTFNNTGWIFHEYIHSTMVAITLMITDTKKLRTSGRSTITESSQDIESILTLDENNWYYVIAQADYTNKLQKLYINGELNNSWTPNWSSTKLIPGTPGNTSRIGNHPTAERNFDGIIDEVKISKTIRSDSWIKTEYNNQVNPYLFYRLEEQETQ